MKILAIIAAILLAAPAVAQQHQYIPTSEMLLHQSLDCEAAASNEIAGLHGQLADLTKERDALKTERDALKAKIPPDKPKDTER